MIECNEVIRKRLSPILSLRPLAAPHHFVLEFQDKETALDAKPGHFIAVGATAPANPGASILRKPFSIYTADKATGVCSVLFSVYGPTTKTMASYEVGEKLDFLGPLGGRVFLPDTRPDVHHVMVGGGYGVPPLNFLAKTIHADNSEAKITVIHGARSANLLVGIDGLRELGIAVISCTDDGSLASGISGSVLAALDPILATEKNVCVYTCGPTPMMRAVAKQSLGAGVPCQVSMETPMPCGVGICVGCVIPKPDGSFSRTCTDGPIYFAEELVW
jgi:dihydroorotate dehydrogenase electron transfer subunit